MVLQDVPTDVSTFGFPLLLKRDALESIAGPEGTVALQVTYAAQRSPCLEGTIRRGWAFLCFVPRTSQDIKSHTRMDFPPKFTKNREKHRKARMTFLDNFGKSFGS